MPHASNKANTSICGAGIGLRACHYQPILDHKPNIPWFEALTDNYLVEGGPALAYLTAIREHYPMVLHGVGLSLGSTDELNTDYLAKFKTLINQIEPAWVSDHLCWISAQKTYLHDLMPLPYTTEVITHLASRIMKVQEAIGQRILIENVSSYFEYKDSEMTEWEFINAIAQQADCYLLLDINNVFVSAYNHNFDPNQFINNIDKHRVKQFHLAGYDDKKRFLFDNHGAPIHQPVWDLYQVALERFGAIPTLIEWDDNIPALSVLQAEAKKAQSMIDALETEACY